jgi:5'-3' exonuclease
MGIKGLNELGKRHAANAFIQVPIAWFAGKRIVIDGQNWMYTNMAIARKKVVNRTDVALGEPNPFEVKREWFLAALNFIIGWLSFNVTPVFTFDGQAPPEKDETKAKRRDAKIAARAKIDALYQQLAGNMLDRPGKIIEELRKELRNYNFIPGEDFELFKMIIKRIGVPTLQARGDGEHLCSALCLEGKVAAVFSADTDNLVYGCPLLITSFSDFATYDEHGYRVPHLECVRLDRLLTGLNLTHSAFVDLCIMSGCDFNTNMPGYAAIKSYKLLQQHGSIDALPRQFNIACLKHIRCREIFSFCPSDELTIRPAAEPESNDEFAATPQPVVNPLELNKRAIATARDCLELVGVSGQIERIITAYHGVTIAADGHIQELALELVPHYIPPVVAPKMMLNIQRMPPVIPLGTPQPTLAPIPGVNLGTNPIPDLPAPPVKKFLTLKIVPVA